VRLTGAANEIIDWFESHGISHRRVVIGIEAPDALTAIMIAEAVGRDFPHLVPGEKYQMRGQFAVNGLEFAVTVRRD